MSTSEHDEYGYRGQRDHREPSRPAPGPASRPYDTLSAPVRDADWDPSLPSPRLWRSRANRVFAGVIGGLAEKYHVEAGPLRLLAALMLPFTGGMLAIPYLITWSITRARGPEPTVPRLWRSRHNTVLGGVMGGLAEKFDMSPNALRIGYVALSVLSAGFPGIFVYLLLWAFTKPYDPWNELRWRDAEQ